MIGLLTSIRRRLQSVRRTVPLFATTEETDTPRIKKADGEGGSSASSSDGNQAVMPQEEKAKPKKKAKSDAKREVLVDIMKALRSWGLEGDYLEFGVYRGRSFIHAMQCAEQYQREMRFFAFDSFEGLPEVTGRETDYKHFEHGQYACTQEAFFEQLKDAEVDTERVQLIPGFFDVSLTPEQRRRLDIQRAAVVWIDCDLYESTVPVLEFILPMVSNGMFLVFDDWFSFGADPEAGEIRATREWLERNTHLNLVEYRKFGTSGIAFLVQVGRPGELRPWGG